VKDASEGSGHGKSSLNVGRNRRFSNQNFAFLICLIRWLVFISFCPKNMILGGPHGGVHTLTRILPLISSFVCAILTTKARLQGP
jgi:hypothetical protein